MAPMVAGAELVIDGDKVTINQLSVTNPELAAYLTSKEGPEQLVALVDLINLAVSVKNLAFATGYNFKDRSVGSS